VDEESCGSGVGISAVGVEFVSTRSEEEFCCAGVIFDGPLTRRLHCRAGRDSTGRKPDEEGSFALSPGNTRGRCFTCLGRRLYETMLYWETVDQDSSLETSQCSSGLRSWNPPQRVVFSTTLSVGAGQCPPGSAAWRKRLNGYEAEPGEGDIAIGGATLAAEWPRWVWSTSTDQGLTRGWLAVASVLSAERAAGWISNSSRDTFKLRSPYTFPPATRVPWSV